MGLAYGRAGASFKGQMQQNFVVLTDKGVKEGGRQPRSGDVAGIPVFTGGKKRALEKWGLATARLNQPNTASRGMEVLGGGNTTGGRK